MHFYCSLQFVVLNMIQSTWYKEGLGTMPLKANRCFEMALSYLIFYQLFPRLLNREIKSVEQYNYLGVL